jgi:heme o synthase
VATVESHVATIGSRRNVSRVLVLFAWLSRVQRIAVELAKLRLVSLVLVSTAVGFVLGGGARLGLTTLVATLLGTGLTAAGSMVLNEVVEQARDTRMQRTQHRPLPAGEVSRRIALWTGLVAMAAGLLVLAVGTNTLTAALGLVVVSLYLLVYTPLKPLTTLCTLVGALCGAIPPMMGWSSATGGIGFGAWVLAALLFCWQIPHFLALAWLYRDDYARGGFRVLPVVDRAGHVTSALANLYIVALLPLGLISALGGLTGWSAAPLSALLALGLLALGIELARTRSERSARRLFLATLLYLPLVLAILVVDRVPALQSPDARPSASKAVPAATSTGGYASLLPPPPAARL